MELLDEKGNLFGIVNVVDVLVVLLVVAVVVAGAALVLSGDDKKTTERQAQTVVVDLGDQPDYVIDAIPHGNINASGVIAVENISVVPTGANASQNTTVRLAVTLAVGETANGLPTFKGERLYVGRNLRLDLRTTIVSGTVVEMRT